MTEAGLTSIAAGVNNFSPICHCSVMLFSQLKIKKKFDTLFKKAFQANLKACLGLVLSNQSSS